MSIFSEKIRKGLLPTEAEWETHLIEAHARAPRMTPEAFATYRTDAGLSSYEILAGVLPEPMQSAVVVDLACGDGHLIPYVLPRLTADSQVVGLDMSPEGILCAREQIRDSRVRFVIARAQALPLAHESVHHVLCHLAFMLMVPLEPVVAELHRVLQPGGQFAALLVGGSPVGLYQEIQRMTGIFVQAHLPRYMDARTGNAGLGQRDVWRALFAHGFSPEIEIYEFQLRYHVQPEGIWEYLSNMYFVPMLSESVQREFKDELMALGRDHRDASGRVLFHVPMKRVLVRKLGASQ